MRRLTYGPKWDRLIYPSPPAGPSSPEIGVRCGKAALRDLRGGSGVSRFPTATRFIPAHRLNWRANIRAPNGGRVLTGRARLA